MQIEWSSEYELGIESIDAQHHKIVDYINELFEIEAQKQNTTQINGVLEKLIDYTYSHFDYEESLLEKIDFDELMLHKLTHDTFKKQINSFKQRHDMGHDITTELAEMLKCWLLEHIMSDDASYAAAVKEQLHL